MKAQKIVAGFLWLVLAALVLGAPGIAAEEQPEVIENETGVYYTIRKGDTLWDLSERFSDSPWQWPNLWEENDQITNPHWIYPGERIRLFRKQDLEKVVKKEAPPEPGPAKFEMVPKEEPPFFIYARIESAGFVRKDPLVTSGTIFKVRGGHELISTGDIVYVEPNPDAPEIGIGERFTIYRNRQWIGQLEKELEKYGTQYFLSGVAEIVDKESGVYLARIVKSFRAIHVQDKLIPYEPRSPKITLTDAPEGFRARVFLAEEHQKNMAADHIVFIDKGGVDDVQRGQVFKIYEVEGDRRDSKNQRLEVLERFLFGELLVIHIESTTATCLVVNSKKQVLPGAVVGNF